MKTEVTNYIIIKVDVWNIINVINCFRLISNYLKFNGGIEHVYWRLIKSFIRYVRFSVFELVSV